MTKEESDRMTTERYLYKAIAEHAVEHLTLEGRAAMVDFLEDARQGTVEVIIDFIQSDFWTDAGRARYTATADALLESFLKLLAH